ncbi:MAG: hypothetical protein KTR32_18490 [Granulosicoccus sp.]|nr:hypothetical protein [Granulosicoccus sp.]
MLIAEPIGVLARQRLVGTYVKQQQNAGNDRVANDPVNAQLHTLGLLPATIWGD